MNYKQTQCFWRTNSSQPRRFYVETYMHVLELLFVNTADASHYQVHTIIDW